MNYGPVATTYAAHRWALEWKLAPLLEVVATLPEGAGILDVGCGTGDYLHALHEHAPRHGFSGFDISPQMLAEGRARCPWATLEVGSATEHFPADSGEIALVYAVDVLHHIEDYSRFFEECARVLGNHGRLIVITDSEQDIRARSMAELFPTTVPVNLARYPAIDSLVNIAAALGFELVSRQTVRGHIELDDRFMHALAHRALSELRLISAEEHAQGMARAEASRARAGRWLSQTTAVAWDRP